MPTTRAGRLAELPVRMSRRRSSRAFWVRAWHRRTIRTAAVGASCATGTVDVAPTRQTPTAPLRISAQDQEVLLNRAGIRGDSPESAKRLAAARKQLGSHLDVDLESRTSPDARLGRLKQWGSFLRHEAYVVVLRVPPKDAHNIFETLNTRGVRLSNGDLVKSHLLSRAADVDLATS